MSATSHQLYEKKFGIVWFAGYNHNKQLLENKQHSSQIDLCKVEDMCKLILKELSSPEQTGKGFHLKNVAHLMFGLVTVYQRQVRRLYDRTALALNAQISYTTFVKKMEAEGSMFGTCRKGAGKKQKNQVEAPTDIDFSDLLDCEELNDENLDITNLQFESAPIDSITMKDDYVSYGPQQSSRFFSLLHEDGFGFSEDCNEDYQELFDPSTLFVDSYSSLRNTIYNPPEFEAETHQNRGNSVEQEDGSSSPNQRAEIPQEMFEPHTHDQTIESIRDRLKENGKTPQLLQNPIQLQAQDSLAESSFQSTFQEPTLQEQPSHIEHSVARNTSSSFQEFPTFISEALIEPLPEMSLDATYVTLRGTKRKRSRRMVDDAEDYELTTEDIQKNAETFHKTMRCPMRDESANIVMMDAFNVKKLKLTPVSELFKSPASHIICPLFRQQWMVRYTQLSKKRVAEDDLIQPAKRARSSVAPSPIPHLPKPKIPVPVENEQEEIIPELLIVPPIPQPNQVQKDPQVQFDQEVPDLIPEVARNEPIDEPKPPLVGMNYMPPPRSPLIFISEPIRSPIYVLNKPLPKAQSIQETSFEIRNLEKNLESWETIRKEWGPKAVLKKILPVTRSKVKTPADSVVPIENIQKSLKGRKAAALAFASLISKI